jgi:hypothetical protein
MNTSEVNKGYAVNYFRAVLEQEKVKLIQHNLRVRGSLHTKYYMEALEDLEQCLVSKLACGPEFFTLGLNKARKDGGSYGRYRDRTEDGNSDL